MFQRFHEYFKGNNIKIFLKYDGERQTNVFTVMIINKDDYEKTYLKNTDNPYEVFLEFINELRCNVSNEVNKMYFEIFMNFKKILDKKINYDYVFIFTSEMIDDIELYISIQSNEIKTNFECKSFKDLEEYIENLVIPKN